MIFGAVTSYCFQLKDDILTGFTFGSSRDDEVLGMDIFCLEVGVLERTRKVLTSGSPRTGLPTNPPCTSPTIMDCQLPTKVESQLPSKFLFLHLL